MNYIVSLKKCFQLIGPDVPKTIIMNAVTNNPTFLLNNQTELAAKYAAMAKPQLRILQVSLVNLRNQNFRLFKFLDILMNLWIFFLGWTRYGFSRSSKVTDTTNFKRTLGNGISLHSFRVCRFISFVEYLCKWP